MQYADERRFAEEMGTSMAQLGLAPAFGKLLGWLLICDPPQQSSTQLAEALGLSKGSVSTGMRMLEKSGLVRRVPSGGRGHAYEMAPDALISASSAEASFAAVRVGIERGLKALRDAGIDETADRARRLRVTRDFYLYVEREVPLLIERFKRENGL